MIHLRLHNHYSVKRAYGINYQKYHNPYTRDPFVDKAKEYGMTHIGISNYGNDHAFVNWWMACKDSNIQPLFGIEFMVTNDMTSKGRPNYSHINFGNDTLIFYAKNNQGYKDLARINTIANKNEHYFYYPRIDYEFIDEQEFNNLLCIIPYDFSTVTKFLLEENEKMAINFVELLKEKFGDDLYFEITSNVSEVNKIINKKIIKLAEKLNVKCIASSNIHYPNKEDKKIHDILLAIGQKKTFAENNLYSLGADDHYFKSEDEVRLGLHENEIKKESIEEYIKNTHEVAAKCSFDLIFPEIGIPNPPIPEGFTNESYFKHLIDKGWEEKILPRINSGKWDEIKEEDVIIYEKRRDYEFNMIKNIFKLKNPEHKDEEGFIPYFLLVRDYVAWAKGIDRRILHDAPIIEVGPARGSISGSLLGYLTDLQTIDPIPWNLTFERFINPERISWPDIDMDFDPENGWWVEKYLIETYGKDRVAHIITFQTMAGKKAFESVTKVLSGSYGKYKDNIKQDFLKNENELKKLLPITAKEAREIQNIINSNVSLENQLNEKHVDFNKQLYEYSQLSLYKEVFEIMAKLSGTITSTGSHPGACIVTKESMWEHCSIVNNGGKYPDGSILYVTSFEKYNCEEINTMKYDILRLRELTIVKNTLKFIEESTGEKINLDNINPFDEETNLKILDILKEGDTDGIFQFSSKLYKGIIEEVLGNLNHLDPKEVAKDLFNIIVALEALGRPGPLEGGMVPTFAEGLANPDSIQKMHPVVDEILKETYGNMLYQEQIMFILMKMGGFSLGQADMVRRGIASGDVNKIEDQRSSYIEGVQKVQLEKNASTSPEEMKELIKLANTIFDLMAKWAGYGFNKAHSVGYGFVSYRGGWLKVNYKPYFMAALISEQSDEDKIVKFIDGLKTKGIKVLPPKMNKSKSNFTVVGEDILFGLTAIKGLGEKAVDNIVENYPFKNILDFMMRTDSRSVGRKAILPLIKVGYFNEDQRFLLKYWEVLYKIKDGKTKLEESLIDFIVDKGFNESTYELISKKLNEIIIELSNKKRTEKTKNETLELINKEDYSDIDLLEMEKEIIGMYLSANPLDKYEAFIYNNTVIQKEFKKYTMKEDIFIVGIISEQPRVILDKNKNEMCFMKIQMIDGIQDVVVFKDSYKKYKPILNDGKIVIIHGKKGRGGGFQANSIADLISKYEVFCNYFSKR